MNRFVAVALLTFGFGAASVWPCDCGALPACAYPASADVIFLGRVSFTNHDDSIGLAQATLVRFEVEETFKGLDSDVRQIWVDPGSFTSCYAVYQLGERYLIFATRRGLFPQDTSAMTTSLDHSGNRKPIPPEFAPAAPPPVYYAAECMGSRQATPNSDFVQDLAMMRAYRDGAMLPRILGHVYLRPFFGWPELDGPALAGARVTISNGVATLTTITDESGAFSLRDALTGDYAVQADLPPYRMNSESTGNTTTGVANGSLHVPEAGCGYTDVQLATTSAIQGVVRDPRGKRIPNVPVWIRVKEDAPGTHKVFAITDRRGQFTISGVPDTDVYLLAGVDPEMLSAGSTSTIETHYGIVYYPRGSSVEGASVLRLGLGEVRESLVLRLEHPLQKSRINVTVLNSDRRPQKGADISTYGAGLGYTKTDGRGRGSVPCVRGLRYEVDARRQWQLGGKWEALGSSRVSFVCGADDIPIVLVLDHAPRR